jgi:hypothetical protein
MCQHHRIDLVRLAGQGSEALDLLRVGDLDIPAWGLTAPAPALQFRALPRVPPDARWHGHAGVRRAGGRRRTAKTGRWLRPIRLGIGASNYAMRSAPSSNSCAEPPRSCARNSIRRTRRSEAADSVIRTQARHSGSSPKPGPGAAVAFGRRCENVSSCRSQRARRGGARSAARQVGSDHRTAERYARLVPALPTHGSDRTVSRPPTDEEAEHERGWRAPAGRP